MEGAGFDVVDLGIDVFPSKFVEAMTDDTDIIGLSALLTTTMPSMGTTIDAIAKAGLRDKVKIIVGGAPVTAAYAEQISADGFAKDASQAATLSKRTCEQSSSLSPTLFQRWNWQKSTSQFLRKSPNGLPQLSGSSLHSYLPTI